MERTRVVAMMEALADPSRLLLMQTLLEQPRCVEEMAGEVGLSASTVSFHLKKLEAGGLVTKTRQQYYSVYSVVRAELDHRLLDLLSFQDPERADRVERARRMRQAVLRTFMPRGTLTRLPVQQQKRRVLLEEMARGFRPGVEYDESEVNERLHRHSADHCLLRRLLVDEGFMARAGGRYWLLRDSGAPVPPAAEPAATGADQTSRRKKEARPMDRKRALKQAYKEMVIPAGVYQIRNRHNGKVFLGGSLNLNAAFNSHQLQLGWGKHRNQGLQQDWTRFGADAFEFSILETISPPEDGRKITADEVKEREKHWFATLQPFEGKGYHDR